MTDAPTSRSFAGSIGSGKPSCAGSGTQSTDWPSAVNGDGFSTYFAPGTDT
jgi:hypothetical protein